jgi:hypothetical protein
MWLLQYAVTVKMLQGVLLVQLPMHRTSNTFLQPTALQLATNVAAATGTITVTVQLESLIALMVQLIPTLLNIYYVAAATYSVTVKNAAGCISSNYVTINNQQHLLHQLPLQLCNQLVP